MAHRTILVLAALALASPALAQPAATPPAPSPNVVAGISVMAGDPPKVVATFPAAGAEVAPGVLILKVAFDQPMTPDAWNYAKPAQGLSPECLATPRLLADGKTFVLLCSTVAGKAYGVDLNASPDKGFINVGDRRSPPLELRFTTSSGNPVRNVKAAMTAAGLKDIDMPVESMGAFVKPTPRTP